MSQLFDRVFKALTDAHYIEEAATPGRFVWRDEDDARRRFKRFHADPVKYAQYIEADLTGLVGGLAAESADFVKALDRVKELELRVESLKLETQAAAALLRDEAERRRIAEEKLHNIKRVLDIDPEPDLYKRFNRPPNLESPFYRDLQKFGHLAAPKIAVELRNFTAKRVESLDPEKIVLEVNAELYYNGNIGISRSIKPGDYVRGKDGQVWQIIAPHEEPITDAESVRRFGVHLDGKRVIGYKEPEDRP